MTTQFEMKQLGKLKKILKIEVACSKKGIFISQRKYAIDLLRETSKLGRKTYGELIKKNHWIGMGELK